MTGPRYTTVASALRTRIATGDIDAGGALESEAELCQRHGVSRITVRRALDELRRDGLVEPRQGAGWFVVQSSTGPALALVGTTSHETVAERVTDPPPLLEFGFVPAGEAAPGLRISARTKVLRCRWVQRSDGRPYELETDFIPADLGRSFTREDIEKRRRWPTLRGLGYEVSHVTQSITAAAATAEQARFLGVRKGTALLFVERVHVSGDRPVLVSHHHYPGEQVLLEMEFDKEYLRAVETAGIRLMPLKATKPDGKTGGR